MMSGTGRIDRFQRDHAWSGFPLAVLYKFFDDQGNYLAALIAYYAFVALFPLLLLATTILGYVLASDPGLQQTILSSALSQFPVVGQQLQDSARFGGGLAGILIGVLGALYGGLGVAQALQYAMNTIWRIPRNSRPNPFKARGLGLLLLALAALAVIGTTTLSALGDTETGPLKVVLLVASVLVNAVVFLLVFRLATARRLSFADVAPGAISAAVVWQLLQTFGVSYVRHVVRDASAINAVFAVVLGLLAFFYLTAIAVVLCAEINVVRTDRLYPRALLTPFTDDVEPTRGDHRAYTGQAVSQRSKGFENIDVTFDKPADHRNDDEPARDRKDTPPDESPSGPAAAHPPADAEDDSRPPHNAGD